MQVQKFKKVTEAMQFDGTNDSADKIALWLSTFCFYSARFDRRGGVASLDIEGQRMVEGDYVIRNMQDYPHVIPLADFLATYQPDDMFAASCTREVLDHRVEGKGGGADDTRVLVLDEPGPGGACHEYAVTDGAGKVLLRVSFQKGPIQEVGVNGVQQEHLQAIVIDRLRSFQAGQFSSRENSLAMTKMQEALMWLQQRTVGRIRRGVEGYNKV